MRRAILHTLATMLAIKDRTTSQHAHRVRLYATALCRQLDCSPVTLANVGVAALLHDIGKIGVSDRVLNKPARLDADEQAEMRLHAGHGGDIAGQLDFAPMIVAGVRHHHERWDGGGYPDGLRGTEIPVLARIVAVADTFDACMEDRPYRRSLGRDRSVQIIREESGRQFCPDAVAAFLAALPEIDEELAQAIPAPHIGNLLVDVGATPAPLADVPRVA